MCVYIYIYINLFDGYFFLIRTDIINISNEISMDMWHVSFPFKMKRSHGLHFYYKAKVTLLW